MRDREPAFESYADLPDLSRPGVSGKVLIGEVDGTTSPALAYSPMCGADLNLAAGADVMLPVEESFEYGVFVVAGSVVAESTTAEVDQLVYLGHGRRDVRLRSSAGGRVIMLGGQPFDEEIVMWWNFIGRSHEEIVEQREAWNGDGVDHEPEQFGVVRDFTGDRLLAPPMPNTRLKPRGRST